MANRLRIWGDKFLSIQSSYKVQSPTNILTKEAEVEELVDDDIGCWKENDIVGIRISYEDESIYSLPIN